MGWLALGLLMLVAGGLLWRLGMPRALASFPGAALMLAGAGYASQEQAGLPGRPVAADAEAIKVDPGMVAFRTAVLPGATAELARADDRLRAGDTRGAGTELLAAIDRRPRDAALWTGLGSAISAHDNGQLSPAARFAFARAIRLAPDQAGPPFFLGMAFVQAGQLPEARIAWLRALRQTPADAPWRIDIGERLMLIDQFQAMADAAASARTAR